MTCVYSTRSLPLRQYNDVDYGLHHDSPDADQAPGRLVSDLIKASATGDHISARRCRLGLRAAGYDVTVRTPDERFATAAACTFDEFDHAMIGHDYPRARAACVALRRQCGVVVLTLVRRREWGHRP